MILLCVGACSPRSEPSVSPPQTQQDAPVSQLPAPSSSNGKSRSLIGFATPPDPQQRVIDRAMLNDQNELGLILDRSVEMNRARNCCIRWLPNPSEGCNSPTMHLS
jgi:hypothetical protein